MGPDFVQLLSALHEGKPSYHHLGNIYNHEKKDREPARRGFVHPERQKAEHAQKLKRTDIRRRIGDDQAHKNEQQNGGRHDERQMDAVCVHEYPERDDMEHDVERGHKK